MNNDQIEAFSTVMSVRKNKKTLFGSLKKGVDTDEFSMEDDATQTMVESDGGAYTKSLVEYNKSLNFFS